MGKKKKEEDPPAGAPMWMATFGDLMSLLLTFFVLLLSFSTIQVTDFNAAMGSLQGALGTLTQPFQKIPFIMREYPSPSSYRFRFIRHGTISEFKEKDLPLLTTSVDEFSAMQDISESISSHAQKAGLSDLISVDMSEKGVKIRIPTVLIFERGKAELILNPEIEEFFNTVVDLMKKHPYELSVEGHSDNRTISNPVYDSNWELASARAVSVLRLFEKMGLQPSRMRAVSHGEYKPYQSNETMRGRKLNRRVELLVDVSRRI